VSVKLAINGDEEVIVQIDGGVWRYDYLLSDWVLIYEEEE